MRILLYGATGFSGQLIAAEAQRRLIRGPDAETGADEVVLGGRDRIALGELTDELKLKHLVFALDDRSRVVSALRNFDVVINAAGPFAQTGGRLARAAIDAGCQYVDINGEVDVYRALDDLGRIAAEREVTMVSGAGFTATVSDVMVDSALNKLRERGWQDKDLGTIRIAVSAMETFSRGSMLTMLRSVREQVAIVRRGKVVHVPVGMIERMFDFGAEPPRPGEAPRERDEKQASSFRIASVVNTIDTLVVSRTTDRDRVHVGSIESYVEMSGPVRLAYQLGALSATIFQLPLVQRVNRLQIAQLPEGPDAQERKNTRHTILLQIESPYRETLVDWRLITPDSYEFTAQSVLAVAARVVQDHARGREGGWKTPSEVLGPIDLTSPDKVYPFKDCALEARATYAAYGAPPI
jgi:short subunit dehydrogenase-like uncharacterized protein